MALANGRRASSVIVPSTPVVPSLIPILNEPGMQPLLPLLAPQAEHKASSPVTIQPSTGMEEKGDNETKEDKRESPLSSSSPLTVIVKPTPLSRTIELTDQELEKCSDLIFFLREHPEICLDIVGCCGSLSVRSFLCLSDLTLLSPPIGADGTHSSLCHSHLCSLVK
jgi:hypothetical protein